MYCFFHSIVLRYSSLKIKRPAAVLVHGDGPNPNQMRINRMIQAKRVLSTPPKPASEFLTTANRLQISLMIRDPFVAAAFRAAEDNGLAPSHVMVDRPRTLNVGAAKLVLKMAEG
jgi:hypothetical protein